MRPSVYYIYPFGRVQPPGPFSDGFGCAQNSFGEVNTMTTVRLAIGISRHWMHFRDIAAGIFILNSSKRLIAATHRVYIGQSIDLFTVSCASQMTSCGKRLYWDVSWLTFYFAHLQVNNGHFFPKESFRLSQTLVFIFDAHLSCSPHRPDVPCNPQDKHRCPIDTDACRGMKRSLSSHAAHNLA